MRRLWDTLGAIAVTTVVVVMVLNMVRPYVPYIIISTGIVLFIKYVGLRLRRW